MAKLAPNSQSSFPLPEWKPRATYLEVPYKTSGAPKASNQAKGVLDMLRVRQGSQPGSSGDISMRFLRSRVHATHSDLLHDAGFGGNADQPVEKVGWKGHDYFIAGRYTARAGRRGPIEVGVMLGSSEQGRDVKGIRGYEELRCTIALAAGYLVANRELRKNTENAQFEVRIIDNFQIPGPVESNLYAADNVRQLTQKLVTG